MRNLTTVGLLAILAATAEAKPAGPPAELMASVALTTGAGMQPVRDLANAFKPGAAAFLTDAMLKTVIANVTHAKGLDGLDTAGWSYLLVTDGGDVAILGKVTDDKQLHASVGTAAVVERDHWAVVGPKPVVDKVSDYALDVLAKQAAPQQLLATVYVPNVMARYKAKLPGLRAAMMATSTGGSQVTDFLAADFDAMMALANDTQRVTIGVDTTATAATIDVALAPVPDSRLAKFVGVQKPSTFALLDKLPPTQAGMLLAGHLETGPYRDGMLEMMVKMYSASVGNEMGTAVAAVMKAATGELAMTADIEPGNGFAMTQVFTLTDSRSAEAAIVHLLDLFKSPRTFSVMGYGTTFTTTPKNPTYDGVTVRGYEVSYDFSKLPADQQKKMAAMFPATVHARVALFDGLAALVLAPKAETETNLVIDTARGKGSHFTPSKQVAELLDLAKARKDSFAFVMDFAKLIAAFGKGPSLPNASTPGVVALGFADRQFHLRFATTFATIKTLAHTGP